MKLQITNIARNLTEEELKKIFEKFGTVLECTLVLDASTGKSKGFGFVNLEGDAPSLKAVDRVNGRMVNGLNIKVKVSK